MSYREFELEWDRGKQYLYKSLFTEGPTLSPIPEYPLQNPEGEVLTRDRDPSPPPPLIIERVPRHRDDDEPEELYTKLERKLRKYYKILFNKQRNDDSSSTEFDEEIYGTVDFDESDLNKAFIGGRSESGGDQVDQEHSSSYEDIDEDDQITGSRVVASTYIIDDERDNDSEVQEEREGQDESEESAHSMILCSNVTRKFREDGQDSKDADTLQNLRVDENWTVPAHQLEAARRYEDTLEDDEGDGDVQDTTQEINNNKTIETEEDNSDHYETIEIEEVHLGDIEMRRKEITPQRSPTIIIDNSFSPIIPTFTKTLDLSKESIEHRLSRKDTINIENEHYKVSLSPRTSTPRKCTKRRSEAIDEIPTKMRNVGVQTSREFLKDVETQTEVLGKNVGVQVNLKTVRKETRWRYEYDST